jgi:hypothetical protein
MQIFIKKKIMQITPYLGRDFRGLVLHCAGTSLAGAGATASSRTDSWLLEESPRRHSDSVD